MNDMLYAGGDKRPRSGRAGVVIGVLVFGAVAGCLALAARADGCNPDMQDCGKSAGYEPAALKRGPVAYGLTIGRGSVCGVNISVSRCDNLKARFQAGLKAENERRRQDIRAKRPVREARDQYRDERGRKVIVIDDGERRRARDYDRGPRRRDDRAECGREIEASGTQLLGLSYARSSAISSWMKLVRYKYGERYMQWENARKINGDGLDCGKSAANQRGWLRRCVATAIPCTSRSADRD